MDEWTEIKDAPGYEINLYGMVRNKKTRRILSPHYDRKGGYKRVDLCGKHMYIHKLMIENVYGYKMKDDEMIRHKDGNKRNNTPSNLKIVKKNVKISPAN